MRLVAVFLAIATASVGGASIDAGAAIARRTTAVDECTLLTQTDAAKIMGVEPYAPGAFDTGGCSWNTDPADRAHFAYVYVKVEGRKSYLGKYPDIHTFLDKSTTVGIDPLRGVDDKAFSTYSGLSGPGSSDGITVAVGKRVLSISFQATQRVVNPSPTFDRVIKVVRRIVARLRKH